MNHSLLGFLTGIVVQTSCGVDFGGLASVQYSLEFWIKADADAGDQSQSGFGYILDNEQFIGPRSGWDIIFSRDSITFERRGADGGEFGAPAYTGGSMPVGAGAWHYVVVSYDGTTGTETIWLDNLLADNEQDVPGATPGGDAGWKIAAQNCMCSGNLFSGILDELAIYDKALDSDTVNSHWMASGR